MNRKRVQLMEECLKMHKVVYHKDQQFENRHRYRAQLQEGRREFRTINEINIFREPKYRDEKGKEYQKKEIFQNKTSLP